MPTEIGQALREARLRQQIEIGAVEQATKIRAKYLRALENEEWDVLPGPAYARSFLRTYAAFLSLDGEVLVDEYRRRHEVSEGAAYPQREPLLGERRRPRRQLPRPGVPRLSGGAIAVLAAAAIVLILLVLGLTAGSGGDGKGGLAGSPRNRAAAKKARPSKPEPKPGPSTVSVTLKPEQPVWVCLLDDANRSRVNGVTLTPGQDQGPFRSKRFVATFGNGFLTLEVDGKAVSVPDTASPLGYEITPGRVKPLDQSARPTCA